MKDPVLAGVIGWPVAHSRSPLLHATWLARYGIRGHYVPLAVAPPRLAEALRALPALGFAGVNVTVPHKQATARIVDRLEPAAARTGSVNMVTVLPDGTLEGASTDGDGFCSSIDEAAPGFLAAGGRALVIGAGGAALAIAEALARRHWQLRLVNRTTAHAQALAERLALDTDITAWAARAAALADIDLVVNATALGMRGNPSLDIDLALLPAAAVVADIVYAPLETPLLAAARARGNLAINGLGMLLHQARPAFHRWYGIEPVVDAALRDAVMAEAT